MSKLVTVFATCALLMLFALPASSAELFEDPATGQLFTKPAPGRTPVGIPAEKMGGLYEDPDTGAVYTKPAADRKPVVSKAVTAPEPSAAAEGEGADYSSSAFAEAVKHVIGEEESTRYPKVKLGALAYIGYSYDFDNESRNSDKSKKNSFSLNRGYINLNADLTPEVFFRFTPDISRISSDDNNNGDIAFRVKYLYAGFHNFNDIYPSLQVKLGQFQGAWLDHEEGLWTYRMEGTMLLEREGFMTSADLGADLQGKLPAGYGEWQANVNNGEGYHSDEVNKYKSVQARLTVNPLPDNEWTKGLELTGFTFFGRQNRTTSKDIYTAFLGYKLKNDLVVGAEYDWTHGADSFDPVKASYNNKKGAGFSVFGWYRMPFYSPVRVMARYDHFDHDTTTPDNTVNRYIYGVSYDLNKYVTFLLDNERTVAYAYKGGYAKAYPDQNLLKVDVQVSF